MPALKVKGNSIGNFRIPGTDIRSIERNRFQVLQLLKLKECSSKRTYPDVAQVFGMFWQKPSPEIDHWIGVKNDLHFARELIASR